MLPPVECQYGVPVRFDGGSPLRFPAFTVVLSGRALGVGSLVLWVFEIRSSCDAFEVVVRSGGDIEPAEFTVLRDAFRLEIFATDSGSLQDGHLVVSTEAGESEVAPDVR